MSSREVDNHLGSRTFYVAYSEANALRSDKAGQPSIFQLNIFLYEVYLEGESEMKREALQGLV